MRSGNSTAICCCSGRRSAATPAGHLLLLLGDQAGSGEVLGKRLEVGPSLEVLSLVFSPVSDEKVKPVIWLEPGGAIAGPSLDAGRWPEPGCASAGPSLVAGDEKKPTRWPEPRGAIAGPSLAAGEEERPTTCWASD